MAKIKDKVDVGDLITLKKDTPVEIAQVEVIYDPYSIEEIEKFITSLGSDDLPTFGGSFEGGINVQQVPSEFALCIKEIIDLKENIDYYLEIGSAAGGSAFIINHFFNTKKIVIVDDNKHPKAPMRMKNLTNIPCINIKGDSHNSSVVDIVKGCEITFDMIMIDGDHIYEGIKQDEGNYVPMLKIGGLLVFHDTKIGFPHGCEKVFKELKDDDRFELIGEYVSEKPPMCGLGLLRKVK